MPKNTRVVTFLSSATKTASFGTNYRNVESYSEAVVFINVTAVSGTSPVLNVKAQMTPNHAKASAGTWTDEGTNSGDITATGLYMFKITNFGSWLRFYATITGTTPSFTLEIIVVLKD